MFPRHPQAQSFPELPKSGLSPDSPIPDESLFHNVNNKDSRPLFPNGEIGREKAVYEALKNGPFWASFSKAEQTHAYKYIVELLLRQ
jgi:hypothetical protein